MPTAIIPMYRTDKMPKSTTKPARAPPFSKWSRRLPLVFCIVATTLVLTAVMREKLLAALAWLSGGTPVTPSNPQSVLTFSSTNHFKITLFEDLHFGEDEFSGWAPRADAATLNVMYSILDNEQPQLAVLNGDLISGDNTYLSNSTDYLDMLVSPLVAHNTPWASTYGNHDHNYNLSVTALLARERTYPLSHTNQMVFHPDAGVSNYYVPIYPPDPGPDTGPALVLYCKSNVVRRLHWTTVYCTAYGSPRRPVFDSLGGHAFQRLNHSASPPTLLPLPSTVHPSVTAWFLATSSALASTHNVTSIPSLAFVHIPTTILSTFTSPHRNKTGPGPSSSHEPGFADEPYFIPQSHDREFVKALLSTKGMMGVFSGHQHGNDWCMSTKKTDSESEEGGDNVESGEERKQKPFFACFGRHTGYGGYGSWERGARVLSLDLESLQAEEDGNGGIETWIRLEKGGISGHVMLNATYGEDVYQKIEKTYTHLDDLREDKSGG